MTTTEMPKRRADAEPTEDLEPVTIRFPKSLRERALIVGRNEDRTFASLVIYALRRYVNEKEQEAEATVSQRAQALIEFYRSQGLAPVKISLGEDEFLAAGSPTRMHGLEVERGVGKGVTVVAARP